MQKIIIVIPTYWKKGPITKRDVVYDHPTDLETSEETLSRTLQSVINLPANFDVLIIGSPTRSDLGREMDKKIQGIVSSMELPSEILFFGYINYLKLKKHLKKEVPESLIYLISNKGYGNVRNLCLLIPYILNYDIAILLDDDEIIADPDFVLKATEFIGRKISNDKTLGLILGYYRNKNGSFFLDEENIPWWEQLFWNKSRMMNEAFRIIENYENSRLVNTPFALGGNMVIHKECFRIPFDPLIARGEDMDYLRNIQYFGFEAKLDRSLFVTHLPPLSQISYQVKFRQDIRRFVYSKLKMSSLAIKADQYNPYPGYFLQRTEGKILMTELLYHIFHNQEEFNEVKSKETLIKKIWEFESILAEAIALYRPQKDSYIRFQKEWEELLNRISGYYPVDIVEKI